MNIKTTGRPTPERVHDYEHTINMLIQRMSFPHKFNEMIFRPEHCVVSAPCLRDSENITADLPLLGADINTL